MAELEERVVSALGKTRLHYKILKNIELRNARRELIETNISKVQEHLLEGAFVDVSTLLPPGVTAYTYSVEILDPNSMLV